MKKKIKWAVLILVLAGNLIAYNQAYRFTHFSEEIKEKTKRPEELSIIEKLNTLFLGINIPKSINEIIPIRDYETVYLESYEKLEGWYIKIPEEKGTIILFHGYSSSKSGMLRYSEEFNKRGYSTFLIDFMGSGGSTGNSTTVGFKESRDVKEAYEYVRNKEAGEVILFGSSMGAVSIMKSISEYNLKPDRIILECPFGSMLSTTKKRFEAMDLPSFPLAEVLLFYGGLQTGFNPFTHNPREYAKEINIRTLLIHGAKDERVTVEEITEIYQNLNGEKELVIMENSDHEVYLNNDEKKWSESIDRFIK